MHIKDFSKTQSILNQFVSELRNVDIQKDRMRFRRNLERIGEILAYELSKSLDFVSTDIKSPLGIKSMDLLEKQPVLCTILRAGLPLHQGMLNYFDMSESTFVSAYRHHINQGKDFEIVIEYLSTSEINDKILIISDPMLATGESIIRVFDVLQKKGKPKAVHIVAAIASKEGIELLNKNLPEDTTLWIASVDDILDENRYIVPGLGDAGDLAFGSKKEY